MWALQQNSARSFPLLPAGCPAQPTPVGQAPVGSLQSFAMSHSSNCWAHSQTCTSGGDCIQRLLSLFCKVPPPTMVLPQIAPVQMCRFPSSIRPFSHALPSMMSTVALPCVSKHWACSSRRLLPTALKNANSGQVLHAFGCCHTFWNHYYRVV